MAVQEALIVLSLLGCDDAGVTCDHIRTVDHRFETVEACSAASEQYLAATQDANYPAIVAVCQPVAELADVPPETPGEVASAPLDTPVAPPEAEEKGFLARVAAAVAGLAPDRDTLTRPLEVAADGAARAGSAVIVGVKRVAKAVNPF